MHAAPPKFKHKRLDRRSRKTLKPGLYLKRPPEQFMNKCLFFGQEAGSNNLPKVPPGNFMASGLVRSAKAAKECRIPSARGEAQDSFLASGFCRGVGGVNVTDS